MSRMIEVVSWPSAVFRTVLLAAVAAFLAVGCSRHEPETTKWIMSVTLRHADGRTESRERPFDRSMDERSVLKELLGDLHGVTGTATMRMKFGSDATMEMEGNLVDGKLEGSFRNYGVIDGKRILSFNLTFANDLQHGLATTYFISGATQSETEWVHGRKHGACKAYYSTGQPAFVGQYVDGRLDGAARFFDPQGAEIANGTYTAGAPRDGTFIDSLWEILMTYKSEASTRTVVRARYTDGVRGEATTIQFQQPAVSW